MRNRVWDILFPRRCGVCDKALAKYEQGICSECIKKAVYIEEPVCVKCGRPITGMTVLCSDCMKNRREFEAGRFPLSYEWIGNSVYRFKYMNRPEYVTYYADVIMDKLGDFIKCINADAFVPVPLHKKRLAKRGYNQAEELSRELSKRTGIPTVANCVQRSRNTIPQKKFNKKARLINMKKAFIVRENSVKLKTIIVVDDIFTTGSTINSLSRELKASGVGKIYFITITAAGT